MNCTEIISIVDIIVSAGLGIWIATAITSGHTKERFLKDYFTNELNSIKEECKAFFDDICYDKKSGQDIKIAFKHTGYFFKNLFHKIFGKKKP